MFGLRHTCHSVKKGRKALTHYHELKPFTTYSTLIARLTYIVNRIGNIFNLVSPKTCRSQDPKRPINSSYHWNKSIN